MISSRQNWAMKNEGYIRSFAVRQGRMTVGQQEALIQYWSYYGIDASQQLVDFKSLFSHDAPVILEIGFGNGDALIHIAAAHPDWNFIGIEVYRAGIGTLFSRLQQQQLTNIKVFCGDAVKILANNIAKESLSGVHLFFSDPWPKRRHHKRRLVQKDFCLLVADKLQKGGYFHLATDWQDYANHMMAVISGLEIFENPNDQYQFAVRPNYRPLTKFEKRGQLLGHEVWDLIVKKRLDD